MTRAKILLMLLAGAAVIISIVLGTRGLDGNTSRPVSSEPLREPVRSELANMATAPVGDSRSVPAQERSTGSKDRRDLVERFRQKIQAQDNTPTFFDNMVQSALRQEQDPGVPPAVRQEAGRVCDLFEQLLESKQNRFVSYEERIKEFCPLTGTKRSLLPQDLLMSQGTHSIMKWKQHDVYKTVFDFAIYWMIMDEIKPRVIVELGSGPGGSAIWFADMASALGFETHVYSYDIKKPDLTYPNVTFIEYDLEGISSTNPLPFKERFTGPILVSEDAHVNVKNVLLAMDSFLSTGDYLFVEDSGIKQNDISAFLDSAEKDYHVDRYYLDFFGKNGSSAVDSIFKVF